MPRPKGSKNKTVKNKIDEMIEEVKKLPVDEVEKAEAIDELEDLLGVEVVVTPEVVAQIKPVKEKKFVGYHPITKEPVYK